MNQLPLELLQEILEYCCIESILEISLINSYFHKAVRSKPIWRSLISRLERYKRFPGNSFEEPDKAFKDLYSLSKLGIGDWISLAESADFASSTDNIQQSVSKILLNDSSFWSSSGSADINSNEEIVISLIGLSLVSCVKVRPYRAAYQATSPIYAPQEIQVYVGINSKNWIKVPIIFSILNMPDLKMLDMSEYCVMGDSIKLVLHKRQQKQMADDLWYTVLEKVEIYGIPLSESTPYLSSMMIKECKNLGVSPSFATDPPISHSQALAIVESFENNFKDLYDYVVKTPAYGPFRNSEILPTIWNRYNKHANNQLHASIEPAQSEYFELLVTIRNENENSWTDFESLEFSKVLIGMNAVERIWRFFGSDIQITEEIGDLVFPIDPELALAIYSERSCMDKILKCLLNLGSFRQAINLLSVARYPHSYYIYLIGRLSLQNSKMFGKTWIDADPSVWQIVANALGVSHLTSLESLKEWLNS